MANFVDKIKIDNQELSLLQERNNLKDIKCLLIGNSYNNGVGGVSGHGWGYYFTKLTGCDSRIIAQNGGDFAAPGNENADYPNRTYAEIIDILATDLTEDERKKYKYVIVGGGWNDGSSTKNPNGTVGTRNGINSFCNKVKTYFPNASIWIIPIGNVEGFSSMAQFNNMLAWCEYGMSNGAHSSSNSITWNYGWSSYANDDGIHLNDSGYSYVGKMIASLILGYDNSTLSFPRVVTSNYTNTTRYIENGMLINLYSTITVDSGLASSTVLLTLPNRARPNRTIYDNAFVYGPSGSRTVMPIAIFSTGEVQLRNNNDTIPDSATIYINSTYMRMLP